MHKPFRKKQHRNEHKTSTYPKLNFNEDPMLAKLDVTELLTGIVSDRCMLLFNCSESSKVADR